MSNYGISSLFLPGIFSSLKRPSKSQDDDKGREGGQNLVLDLALDTDGDLEGVVRNPVELGKRSNSFSR